MCQKKIQIVKKKKQQPRLSDLAAATLNAAKQ